MSYDFIFMRLSPTPPPGAVSERVSGGSAQQPIASLAPLRDALRAERAVRARRDPARRR